MSEKGRKQILEAVAENQQVVQYVKLFRMPLFLTVLDDELKKYDDSAWTEETAFRVMPGTLQQFGFPQDEIENVISQCLAEFMKK